mmetsp:Transcript_1748/g.5308  ORF Transcript_1748/g.5308 Transcript_1748/m.5308 type:complete len:149 (-) Transcript_1748:1849-2295(-)
MSTLRNFWIQLGFGTNLLSRGNVVKSKNAAPSAYDVTAKLRQQYVATTWERLPARAAELREEVNHLRDRISLFFRRGTIDPQTELLPMAWLGIEATALFLVGRVVGRRSLQFADIVPYDHEHHGGEHPDEHAKVNVGEAVNEATPEPK